MASVKAVLFDLDGTLVDSAADLAHAVNAVLTRRALEPLDVDTVSSFLGKGAPHLIQMVARARNLPEDEQTLSAMLREYAQVLVDSGSQGTVFFPGVIEALHELRAAGIRIGLVTNKMRSITVSFLESRKVSQLFDTVVAGDDTECPKPAPDMLLLAMRSLSATADQTVMVGDSRNDALAGRNAGTRVFLVSTGYNEGEPIDQWAQRNGFGKSLPGIAEVAARILQENR